MAEGLIVPAFSLCSTIISIGGQHPLVAPLAATVHALPILAEHSALLLHRMLTLSRLQRAKTAKTERGMALQGQVGICDGEDQKESATTDGLLLHMQRLV
jgi:hypothetical protein